MKFVAFYVVEGVKIGIQYRINDNKKHKRGRIGYVKDNKRFAMVSIRHKIDIIPCAIVSYCIPVK